MKRYKLWLEFEILEEWNKEDCRNNFCNISADLMDGRSYHINVWTFDFLKTAIENDISRNQNGNGSYIIPPDLFVKELTRDCIESTLDKLLAQGELDELLNTSIFGLNFLDPWLDIMELQDFGESLKNELIKELNPDHELFKYIKEAEVLAKRQDKDDILISFDNGQLAKVHLTWSGQIESDEFLNIICFASPRDFWGKQLNKDILEYRS